jgi:amylosucrase
MTHALQQMPPIPSRTSWLTYVRCHDDIGWAVTEEDAAAVGLNGFLHRSFLSDFYSGRFEGTFARGATFQFNPRTNDRRISGSCASLAGLETAETAEEVNLAIGRILLIHSMILAFGGIPLLYMGDEIGLLNDDSYEADPNLAQDNRWLHRPFMDWEQAAKRHDWATTNGRLFHGMRQLISVRKKTTAFHAEAASYAVWTDNEHLFGLLRVSPRGRNLVIGNFSEWGQAVRRGRVQDMGLTGVLQELITGQELDEWSDIYLKPYQAMWLTKRD